jgi:SH3 domain protein
MGGRLAPYVALVLALLLGSAEGWAQTVWVKDEVRLNVRTGPGTEFRIVSSIGTGDSVRIVERAESWTKVRMEDGSQGWVPGGFLQTEPPARVILEQQQSGSQELSDRLQALSEEVETLRAQNQQLSANEAGRSAEIERLTRENMSLRAGARYPEYIAGASILIVGGILGAWLRGATRRQSPRIRL